jgi:hypothetical protein
MKINPLQLTVILFFILPAFGTTIKPHDMDKVFKLHMEEQQRQFEEEIKIVMEDSRYIPVISD